MTVAVLITSFNRKDLTFKCIHTLNKFLKDCSIYLVDDNSTDGTKELVASNFSNVKIINGNGNLFWSRGMRLAWLSALKDYDYDFYLWLNDDVVLYDCFFDELFWCLNFKNGNAVVSGLIEDFNSNIIYGGFTKNKDLVQTSNLPIDIKFMNGNVVLVSKEVVSKIGVIDPIFHHDLGDVDYGLRALKSGISVVSTRVPVGLGSKNISSRIRKDNLNIFSRFKFLYSPLGSPPFINLYFRVKHFGVFNAIVYFVYLHLINSFPDLLFHKVIRRFKY
ncbi:MAG: glycosyltransferase family 2 protein [Spirosomataceae bacterium]